MNMTPDEFWDITMRAFLLKQRGYLEAIEDEQIHGWNMTRVLACYTLKPHLKKGSKLQPKDIMYLPIDGTSVEQMDIAKKRRAGLLAAKRMAKAAEKNKGKEKKQVGVHELLVRK
jgi:hypothetical protein